MKFNAPQLVSHGSVESLDSYLIDSRPKQKFDLNIMRNPMLSSIISPMGANFRTDIAQNMREATYYTNTSQNLNDFSKIDPIIKSDKSFDTDKVQSVLKGINPNCKSPEQKRSLLHIAAQRGNIPATAFLISAGLCVDATDKDKNTPLMAAVKNNHLDEVQLLIGVGANVHARNIHGDNSMRIAEKTGNKECLALLREGQNQLRDAFNQFKTKGEVTSFVEEGDSPAYKENLDRLQVLLDQPDFDSKEFNKLCDTVDINKSLFPNGNTLLHEAAERGHIKAIDSLLARGADIDAVQETRMTPMMLAVQHQHNDAVMHLHAKGANPFARNMDDQGVMQIMTRQQSALADFFKKNNGQAIF